MALMDSLLGRPSPDAVVCEHGAYVMAVLRRTFGPKADVEDVYQAVFVEVLRALPAFRGSARLRT